MAVAALLFAAVSGTSQAAPIAPLRPVVAAAKTKAAVTMFGGIAPALLAGALGPPALRLISPAFVVICAAPV